MKEPASILTMMYDFLLYLVPQLSKFPRDHKFMLGDRTQTLAHDILDDFITAYYAKFSPEKIAALRQANLKLERLRYCIRLSHDLKLFSDEKYGGISLRIQTLGGTLGNWVKELDVRSGQATPENNSPLEGDVARNVYREKSR